MCRGGTERGGIRMKKRGEEEGGEMGGVRGG